jgi:hypothetical protein
MPKVAVTENGNARSDKDHVRLTNYFRDVCPEAPAESPYFAPQQDLRSVL